MPPKKTTATAYHQLGQVLRDLETDLRWRLEGSARIPAAWHDIAQERIHPPRQKISLRVDADVLRFFRAMGEGHLARMNAVLRAFMLARLAEVVKGEADYTPPPEEEPLSAEDQKFFDYMDLVNRSNLSEEAKTQMIMKYEERRLGIE